MSPRRNAAIAIDGPVASGKNTVGMLLAQRLSYCLLDTGAMYRALTWAGLQQGVNFNDEAALVRLADATPMRVTPATPERPLGELLIGGVDVTPLLRGADVEHNVSLLARVPGVRLRLVEAQRRLAGEGGVVMIGRDIGTVVLPNADLKVYLDASVTERARRRHTEVAAKGDARAYQDILVDLERRDALDAGRADSPMRPADDARILPTDGLSPDEVVEAIVAMLEERHGRSA